MGWIEYRDKSRLVVICILLLLVVIVMTGSLAITGLKQLSEDSKNLYQKELIPAMDMSLILEKLYQNRFHLEEHITGVSNESYFELQEDIYDNNIQIDSVIQKYFDITRLDQSHRYLIKQFNDNIKAYRKLEGQILKLSRGGKKDKAADMFKLESYDKFQNVVEPILSFSNKSLQEGRVLYEDSVEVGHRIRIALYVSISIGFVIVIITGIIISRAYLD